MSGDKKSRNIAMAKSFIHTNPGPKTEPPFSALKAPHTEPPARTQSSKTSNPGSVTSTDK